MALVVNDRVKETTAVVGTGTATLLGAALGFQTFAVIGNGNTTYYCISDKFGSNWEVGIGTYTASGATLARTTVLSSSNANALVVFTAGIKDVFVTYPSSKGLWKDASDNAIGLGTPSAGVLTNCTLPQLSASTGSTLVGTTNGGTGAVTRTVASKLNETVSVKDFGAVGDGVTDDTAAIQNALNTGKTLFIPDGIYNCTSPLTSSGKNVCIKGESKKGAVLLFSAAGLNFSFDVASVTNIPNTVDLREFTVRANSSITGIGVNLVWTTLVAQGRESAYLEINIECNDAGTGSFSTALSILNCFQSYFNGLYIIGAGTGTGVIVDSCITAEFIKCDILGFATGFKTLDTNHQCEGIIVSNCTIYNNTIGMDIGHAIFVNVSDTHVLGSTFAVKLTGYLSQSNFTNNTFYVTGASGVGIELTSVQSCGFSNTVIQAVGAGYATATMIHCTSGAYQNRFTSLALDAGAIGMLIDSGSSDNSIVGGIYQCSTPITDNSTSTHYSGFNTVGGGGAVKIGYAANKLSFNTSNATFAASYPVYVPNIIYVQGGIELGNSTTGGGSYIDFHSIAGSVDYDSRMISVGGATSPAGQGALTVNALSFRPQIDNTTALGGGSFRWTTVYAATATINTSDGRLKTEIESLDAAELATAKALKGLIKKFKYTDSVAEKGTAARIHVGVIAQEVEAAFIANGLDATQYGIFCYDEWEETLEVKDDKGKVIIPYSSSGNRYGIRYEELLAFIISAL